MAIQTYSDLRSTVADWLNRSDLTAVVPSFITLAEAGFNKDERLRVSQNMVRATAQISKQYEALPADYLEMSNVAILGVQPYGKLDFVSLQQIDGYRDTYVTNGVPKMYTVYGNQMEFLPKPGGTYTCEMIYYAKIPALSDTNTTNWLLTKHPDIYLYGALVQAAPYLKDDERIPTWMSLLEKGLDALQVGDDRALYSGSAVRMRAKSLG